MQTSESKKTRIITLTDRRPIKIVDEQWPIVASGSGDSWDKHPGDSRYRQARDQGELDTYAIRVRRHEDGRTIVYAVFSAATFRIHPGEDARGGFLLGQIDDAELVERIRQVGEACDIPTHVVNECIADLEPEEI